MNDSVSILIPNRNGEAYLNECIQSCFAQTLQGDLEVIVIDDHSTDGSMAILEGLKNRFGDRLKVAVNEGQGGNSARNQAFKLSTGSYVQWLDSDDTIAPGKLETQIECLKSTGADIVYSDWELAFFEGSERIRTELKQGSPKQDYLYELLIDNWQPCHSYLMTRGMVERLKEIGGWNERTKVSQDREYFTKAAILDAEFTYCEGNFASYRRYSSGTVSGITHKERLKLNLIIDKGLLELMRSMELSNFRKYANVLRTNSLIASYYDMTNPLIDKFGPWNVRWFRIHWKMRLVAPFIYLYQIFRSFILGEKVALHLDH